jgi:hypothetical protein
MTTQDSSTSRGRKTWILGAGLVAIAAIVAYLGFDYPPASDDAAGDGSPIVAVLTRIRRADGAKPIEVATNDLGVQSKRLTPPMPRRNRAADSASAKSASACPRLRVGQRQVGFCLVKGCGFGQRQVGLASSRLRIRLPVWR